MQAVKKGWAVAVIIVLALIPVYVWAHGNEKGTTSVKLKGGMATIDYMRPTLKGRDLFSLIEPGSYWRLGADSPTRLSTDVALTMGKASVPAGQYTLVMKCLGDNNWSLIVAEGAARGSWEPQGLVAEVPLAVSKTDSSVEALTIELEAQGEAGKIIIEWGTTRMVADFVAA
jgi:Protein of unknown function (DUF2911)